MNKMKKMKKKKKLEMQDLEVPVDCICEEIEGFKNE